MEIHRAEPQDKIAKRRRRRMQALVGGLALPFVLIAVLFIAGVVYLLWRDFAVTRPFVASTVRPYILGVAAEEQALMPKDRFRENAQPRKGSDYCPEMVVIPAYSFVMGSEKSQEHLKPQREGYNRKTVCRVEGRGDVR